MERLRGDVWETLRPRLPVLHTMIPVTTFCPLSDQTDDRVFHLRPQLQSQTWCLPTIISSDHWPDLLSKSVQIQINDLDLLCCGFVLYFNKQQFFVTFSWLRQMFCCCLLSSERHDLHIKGGTSGVFLQLSLLFSCVWDGSQWLISASALMSARRTQTGMIIALDQVLSYLLCAFLMLSDKEGKWGVTYDYVL